MRASIAIASLSVFLLVACSDEGPTTTVSDETVPAPTSTAGDDTTTSAASNGSGDSSTTVARGLLPPGNLTITPGEGEITISFVAVGSTQPARFIVFENIDEQWVELDEIPFDASSPLYEVVIEVDDPDGRFGIAAEGADGVRGAIAEPGRG